MFALIRHAEVPDCRLVFQRVVAWDIQFLKPGLAFLANSAEKRVVWEICPRFLKPPPCWHFRGWKVQKGGGMRNPPSNLDRLEFSLHISNRRHGDPPPSPNIFLFQRPNSYFSLELTKYQRPVNYNDLERMIIAIYVCMPAFMYLCLLLWMLNCVHACMHKSIKDGWIMDWWWMKLMGVDG